MNGIQEVRGSIPLGSIVLVGYQSGQMEQTVNLPAYAYVGSNPTPTTLRTLRVLSGFAYARGWVVGRLAQLVRALR